MDNNLAFVFLGNFARLGPNFGVMNACFQASQKGFQPPDYAVGSSAANIDLLIASQWDEQSFRVARHLLLKLKRKQFAGLNPSLKKKLALELLATTLLLLPTHKAKDLLIRHGFSPGLAKLVSYGLPVLLAGLAYYSEEKMVEGFFKTPSLLVYDNLKHLLSTTVDFSKVFNSPLKIEVPAVNMNKAGWTLDTIYDDNNHLKGWTAINNFEPRFVNLDKAERKQKMVNSVVNGARVFGFFNPEQDETGDYITDTAALSNIPIQFAIKRGYTNIVVFVYNCTSEGPIDTQFDMLAKALPRNFDIMASENTRKTILGYLRVNNDLEELEKQRLELLRLEEMLKYPSIDDASKLILSNYIHNKRASDKALSYANKKLVNIMFVSSDYLPPIHFSKYTPEDIETGILIGEKAFWDNVPKIERMRKERVKALD